MFTFKSDTILIVFMIVQVVVVTSNQTQELSIKYIISMYDCSIIDKAMGLAPQRRYLRTPLRGDCNAIYEV